MLPEASVIQGYYVYEYTFLDDDYKRLYEADTKVSMLSTYFAILATLISCLGLFGLAVFSSERRMKEIGIRKVLGASVQQVLLLVAKEFLLLVGIAFILAVPVSWWVMHTWLQDFAYRAPVAPWIFLLAGFLMTLVALITVGSRAFSRRTGE